MPYSVGLSGGSAFLIFWLFWVALLPVTWGLGIWAIIDASRRPEWAFESIKTSRTMWIVLCAVFSISFVPVGLTCSLIYLFSVRPKVAKVMAASPDRVAPSVDPAGTPSAPVGWYPDPRNPAIEWFWDGQKYTVQRPILPPPPPTLGAKPGL